MMEAYYNCSVSTTLTTIHGMFAEAGSKNVIRTNYNIGTGFRGFSAIMDAE
jgi:hypothetical protein